MSLARSNAAWQGRRFVACDSQTKSDQQVEQVWQQGRHRLRLPAFEFPAFQEVPDCFPDGLWFQVYKSEQLGRIRSYASDARGAPRTFKQFLKPAPSLRHMLPSLAFLDVYSLPFSPSSSSKCSGNGVNGWKLVASRQVSLNTIDSFRPRSVSFNTNFSEVGNPASGPRLWPKDLLTGSLLGLANDQVSSPLLPRLRVRVVLQQSDGSLLTLFDVRAKSWERFEGSTNGLWLGFLAWSSEIPLDEDDGSGAPEGGHFADSVALDIGLAIVAVGPQEEDDHFFVPIEAPSREFHVSLETASVIFFTEHSHARERWLRFLSRLSWS